MQLDVKEARIILKHPQWDISEEEEVQEEESAVEDSDLLDDSEDEDEDNQAIEE